MLFKKNKHSNNRRRSNANMGSDFRRNTVVISRQQREVETKKQSVTDRQVKNKKIRRSKLFKRRLITISLLVFIISLSLRYQITGFNVKPQSGVTLTDQSKIEYEQTMNSYTDKHTPLKQSWLLDQKGMVSYTVDKHPEISKIRVSSNQPFTTNINAKLSFRKPIFILEGVGESYFIDKDGVLFTKNMYKSQNIANLPKIEDQGGISPDPGQTILTDTVVSDIAKIYNNVPAIYKDKNKVSKVILPPAAREIRVQLEGIQYYLKFSTDREIEEQVGELQVLLGFIYQNNISPGEYIDLRVANKAYYK